MCLRANSGQATVETAFLIPVLFVLALMLIQPGIILYDRLIMDGAAAHGCRLLATKTAAGGYSDDQYVDSIKRHLGAIPQQTLFHIHEGGCSYAVRASGDEQSQRVSVEIDNEIQLLPLFDVAGTLTGVAPNGRYRITVSQGAQTKPSWFE